MIPHCLDLLSLPPIISFQYCFDFHVSCFCLHSFLSHSMSMDFESRQAFSEMPLFLCISMGRSSVLREIVIIALSRGSRVSLGGVGVLASLGGRLSRGFGRLCAVVVAALRRLAKSSSGRWSRVRLRRSRVLRRVVLRLSRVLGLLGAVICCTQSIESIYHRKERMALHACNW